MQMIHDPKEFRHAVCGGADNSHGHKFAIRAA